MIEPALTILRRVAFCNSVEQIVHNLLASERVGFRRGRDWPKTLLNEDSVRPGGFFETKQAGKLTRPCFLLSIRDVTY
jgi:hypothetical protein